MKVCAYFLLFGIFANTHPFAYTHKINSKSVNLALKTVFEFNEDDKQNDIKLLDDIQNVITDIRTVIDKNSIKQNFRRNARDKTLTDFIQEAVDIINTYEDTAFDDFVHILDDEIRKYHYRGCKFSELTGNQGIEKLITAKLDSIKAKPTYVKKSKINALSDVLKYENYDSDVKKIVDYINSLYTQAGDKFRRILSNLKGYGKQKSRRSYTNLVKIIKNGLRSIIFGHYTNLSLNTRRNLKYRIETFWKRYKKNHLSKRVDVAKVTPYNTKNSNKIIDEEKNLEHDSGKYQINTNNNTTSLKTKPIKIKQSEHKNQITKKNDLNNEMKRHKNIHKETIDESFETHEKETRQTSQNTDLVVQQWTKIKNQYQTGDVDSLSASVSSIEFYKDQQDNTRQFIEIETNVTKKPEIFDTLNVMTKTPTNNTTHRNILWIEQSTGRLPQSVLDKLANYTSRSNPNLMGKYLNNNGPKHTKNRDRKRWHRKVNKPDETRRQGYEPENTNTDEKMYDLQSHKTLRYSELMRDKANEKINQLENDKTHGQILYEQAGDKTRENVNELENEKSPGNVYKSENDKVHEKIYEMENDRAEEKIYDKIHESERPTKHRLEFVSNNYESKEDVKYNSEKNLKPNKPMNIKRYDTEHELKRKTQEKGFEPVYAQTHGEIYEFNQDKMHGNAVYDKDGTGPAIKKQLMYELEEDKKYKPYNTSKPEKPSIVKHNYGDLFNQFDVGSTNSLINKKVEDVHQYKNTKGMLRVELNHDNRPIRTARKGFLQVLDVQMQTEPDKTIKHTVRGTATTRKVPAFSRPPRLELDDIASIKPTHQTSALRNSSIGWLYVPLKAYSKNNNNWSRKSTEYSTPFKEGITVGNIKKIDDNGHTAQTTSFSFLKDSYVNKSIKNLERQVNEVKNRASDNTEEVRKVKQWLEVKSNVVKPEQIGTISTLDDTLRQDRSKMADAVDNETEFLKDYVTDKDSKIKDYDVIRGIMPETRFRSGVNMISADFKVKDELKIAETPVNKTEFSIEDLKDNYAKNNIENAETGSKTGFEMTPIDNMVRLNKNKDNVSTNNDIDGILKKDITSETRFRSGLKMVHKNFKDMTDKTEVRRTADNITEYVIEENKDTLSIINLESYEKSEANFVSDIHKIPNYFNDKTDQNNTKNADIKTEFIEKENYFKSKEGIVDKDHQIYPVDGQTSIIREVPKEKNQIEKATKQHYIDGVTFEANDRDMKYQDGETRTKDSEIIMIMKGQKDHDFLYNDDDADALKGGGTPTRNIAATSSPMKGTESTTKASITTIVLPAPTTPKLTVPQSVLVVTSSKAPDVWRKAKFNAIVNENKNRMADTLPHVNVNEEAKTHISSTARIRTKVNHRGGANPAIDNVSELSNEEYSGDTKNIDNVHDFITRVIAATNPKTREDDDKQKQHKLEKRNHENTHFISEYNAVIDVQLANLLKSLGIFEPVPDDNSRYDTTLYRRSFRQIKPVPTKPITHYRAMRASAEPNPTKPTAPTKPPSRYTRIYKSVDLKPPSNLMRNLSSFLSNGSNIVIQLMKDNKRKRIFLTRRNALRTANNSNAAKDFNKDILKRIDALEHNFQQLKQMINVQSKKYDNYTDKYDANDKFGNKRNVTLKYNVVRLMKEYEDMNKRNKVLIKNNNDGNSTINTESTTKNTTYSKQSVIDKDVANTTVIDDINVSQVTRNNVNDTKELNKENNDNNSETAVTVSSVKVTDTTELEPVNTTTTAEVTTITVGYPKPVYYDDEPDQNPFLVNGQVDPFGHIDDGLNLNNYGI